MIPSSMTFLRTATKVSTAALFASLATVSCSDKESGSGELARPTGARSWRIAPSARAAHSLALQSGEFRASHASLASGTNRTSLP